MKPDSTVDDATPQPLFQGECDFERSFADLEGCRGFYAEAQRGRIRSQQLRFEEAWRHFDRAEELAEEAEENLPNLIRGFLLHIWCFENAIVEAPLIEMRSGPPAPSIPELPRRVMEDHPEVKLVLDMRRHAEALLRLHLGQWDVSRRLYRRLIEDNRRDREGLLALYYSGLAACQDNLGMHREARRSLEDSGLAVLTGGQTIHRAMAMVVLSALYRYLGEEEEATIWVKCLESLSCPKATKDVFLERERILLDRCARKSSLLVF